MSAEKADGLNASSHRPRSAYRNQGEISMKNQIDVAIRAVQAAKKEINEIKKRVTPTDPCFGTIDDAELGAAWVMKRLEELKKTASARDTKQECQLTQLRCLVKNG
jgi:hypothetical protein